MKRLAAAVALVLVLFGAMNIATAAVPEPRVALVIGNSAYADAPLANPANDARLMAETLRGLGFNVIERVDANQREMKLAIFELGDRLEAAGKDAVGLFYYAGHGVQVEGQNYLIPLNAEIERERHVAIEAVGASWVLGQMEFAGNRVNFVILDACRNNPMTRSFRSQLRGLAKMNAPTGSLVAYSTGPGDVAVDGDGANSPYTLALSRVMQTPGLPAEKVFKLVRDAVREETKGKQTPWEESSMTGADFYLRVSVAVTVEAPEVSATSDTAAATQQETVFWQSIQNSTDPAMFEAYLQSYPNGAFANIATLKRDALKAPSRQETQTAAIIPPPEPSIQVEEMDATFVALKTSNVRAEPTTESSRVGRLSRDDAVAVTGKVKDTNWYRMEYKGETAFVFGALIKQIDPGELAAWESIANSSDHADFVTFLANFPDQHFAERARVKRDLVTPAPAPEPAGLDLAFWESIKDSPNPVDYEAYLRQHPEGHFAALARARLTAIMEAQRREAERRDAERKAAEEAKRKAAKEARRKEAERVAAEKKRRAAKKLKDAQTAAVVPPPTQNMTRAKRAREVEQWTRNIVKYLGRLDQNPTIEQIRLVKDKIRDADREVRTFRVEPTSDRISSGALRATKNQCIYELDELDLEGIGKEVCECWMSNMQLYLPARKFKEYTPSYGVFNYNSMPSKIGIRVAKMLLTCFNDYLE